MHAWEAPTDEVTQAITKAATTDDRPDPPDVDGEDCEVLGCREPAKVPCWSTELETYFRFCESCSDDKTSEYPDLEVVD